MPVIIPEKLPATEALAREYIFVMHQQRAQSQDIRPLKIAIVNLMPKKIVTETQLLRLISNTSLQVEVDLIHTESHLSKNTPEEHLLSFYLTFEQIKHKRYDGMIITGAPVELLDFEEVDYWPELTKILDFAKTNVHSTLFICWASQAALYYYYGVPKTMLPKKLFGVYPHRVIRQRDIVRGFDDMMYAPHSRYTENNPAEIAKIADLKVVIQSDEAGVLLAHSIDQRHFFISGHMEYDPTSLRDEYERDLAAGLAIDLPENYFPGDDPSLEPMVNWRSHGHLLFANWLNYHVYQSTPYNLEDLVAKNGTSQIIQSADV